MDDEGNLLNSPAEEILDEDVKGEERGGPGPGMHCIALVGTKKAPKSMDSRQRVNKMYEEML